MWDEQCGMNCNSNKNINAERWKQLKTKSKDWEGLDKIGNVFESTDWEKLKGCTSMKDVTSIQLEKSPTIPKQLDLQKEECKPSPPKHLRSSIGGPV